MKLVKIFVNVLLAIFFTSCCFEQDEPRLPEIYIDFRDSTTDSDIFTSGAYSLDDVVISSAISTNHPFDFSQFAGKTVINFSVAEERYTIQIGEDLTVELSAELSAEDKGCYTEVRINDVSVKPFGYVASSDVNLGAWSVTIFTN